MNPEELVESIERAIRSLDAKFVQISKGEYKTIYKNGPVYKDPRVKTSE